MWCWLLSAADCSHRAQRWTLQSLETSSWYFAVKKCQVHSFLRNTKSKIRVNLSLNRINSPSFSRIVRISGTPSDHNCNILPGVNTWTTHSVPGPLVYMLDSTQAHPAGFIEGVKMTTREDQRGSFGGVKWGFWSHLKNQNTCNCDNHWRH